MQVETIPVTSRDTERIRRITSLYRTTCRPVVFSGRVSAILKDQFNISQKNMYFAELDGGSKFSALQEKCRRCEAAVAELVIQTQLVPDIDIERVQGNEFSLEIISPLSGRWFRSLMQLDTSLFRLTRAVSFNKFNSGDAARLVTPSIRAAIRLSEIALAHENDFDHEGNLVSGPYSRNSLKNSRANKKAERAGVVA
jgi:hypothetical protein